MTFFHRAATLAAFSLCVAGMASFSTPGFATEAADKTPIDTASLKFVDVPNVGAIDTVPSVADIDRKVPPADGVMVQKIPDEPDFASLSDAVAAQDMPAAVDAELACLAGAVYFESKGEPLSGQLAVADVIINRAQSGRFPDSICSVVTQHGQFSFVRGGRIPQIDSNRRSYRTAMAVAQVALAAAWDSPVPKALFFHAKRVSPGWGMTKIAAIGHHVFYR